MVNGAWGCPRAVLAWTANDGVPSVDTCYEQQSRRVASGYAGARAGETSAAAIVTHQRPEDIMANEKGPNIKKKKKCKNCEGKGLLKKGDKVVKCQRCGGTGFR